MTPNAEAGDLLSRMLASQAALAFEASAAAQQLAAQAPDNLASLRSFFTREPVEMTAALLRRISADGPCVREDELRALFKPAVVIGSDADLIHPWPLAEHLASLIPGARLLRATPKGVDRATYIADLHRGLGAFFEEVSHA